MNCYNHHSVVAVAICKYCAKAVCNACAISNATGISCSNECATEINELQEMNTSAKKIYGIGKYNTPRNSYSAVLAYLLMGAFMLVFGAIDYFRDSLGIASFMISLGGIFILIGLIEMRRRAKLGIRF